MSIISKFSPAPPPQASFDSTTTNIVFVSKNLSFNSTKYQTYFLSSSKDIDYLNNIDLINLICLDMDSINDEILHFLLKKPFNNSLKNIPVILISKNNENIEEFTKIGINDYYVGCLNSPLFAFRLERVLQYHSLLKNIHHSQTSSSSVELAFMAFYDPLTGLPNRQLFEERVKKSIESASQTNSSFALMFLDLDDFKNVNDTYSHQAGDWLLTQVAERLKNSVRPFDKVARIGGDEFGIILNNLEDHSISVIEKIAHRILYRASSPYLYKSVSFKINISIGISLFPQDGNTYQSLIERADKAMYISKKGGKGRFAFAKISS